MKLLIGGAGFLALMAAAAHGQDAPPPGAPRPPLTRDAVSGMVAHRFAAMDTNGDGAVTRDEYQAAADKRRAAREARRDESADANGAPSDGPRHRGGGGGMVGMVGMGPRWFDEADANHDGKVTLAEAQTVALGRFDRMDTNHDGTLQPQELWAMHGGGQHGPDQPQQQ